MMVTYVLGGGLGHLTRVRAAAYTLGRPDDEVVFATVSHWAADRRVTGTAHVVPLADAETEPDAAALRRRLAALCADPAVTDLVIDAFPCGLVGELIGFDAAAHVRVTYLARLLRWDRYGRVATAGSPPRIDTTLRVESLTLPHERWIHRHGGEVGEVVLVDPPVGDGVDRFDLDAGTWLVVHSGPPVETDLLVQQARTAGARRVEVIGPGGRDEYPAWQLFPHAAGIVTAAGFNCVRQAAPWRDKHHVVPFARRFDDQRLRAWRSGWSGGGAYVTWGARAGSVSPEPKGTSWGTSNSDRP